MTTFTVAIALATTALNVPASSPAEGVTLVEILDASGAVESSQTTGYLFTGITQGDKTMRASLLDVNGALIGAAYTQAFTAHEETRTVQVPSGATITVTPDAA